MFFKLVSLFPPKETYKMNSHLINACYCQNCAKIDYPKKQNKGTILTEGGLLFLTVAFAMSNIVWGGIMFALFVAYSLWRVSNKIEICPFCKSEKLLPANSPQVQGMLNEYKN